VSGAFGSGVKPGVGAFASPAPAAFGAAPVSFGSGGGFGTPTSVAALGTPGAFGAATAGTFGTGTSNGAFGAGTAAFGGFSFAK